MEGDGEEVAMATDDAVANSDGGDGDYSEDLESISSDIFSRALFENIDDQVGTVFVISLCEILLLF